MSILQDIALLKRLKNHLILYEFKNFFYAIERLFFNHSDFHDFFFLVPNFILHIYRVHGNTTSQNLEDGGDGKKVGFICLIDFKRVKKEKLLKERQCIRGTKW